MYALYLRSGFATALREAIRSTDFYLDRINASGYFSLSSGDPKYAYNESLAYTYWLLGDNRMLAPISTVVNAHNGSASRWSPSLNFWTERNAGYKLLANEIAYEVTGGATFKSNVQTIVNDFVWHQNGAGGQLPANRVDGGLYHTGQQHDISEASSANVLIASSWMSALVIDPMVRVFGVWQNNSQVSDFIIRMGTFEKVASKTDSNGDFGGTTRYPDYLMRFDGTSDNRLTSDVQHAMDVGSAAAWATYFAELRGTPDASLRQLANDLYATYDAGVNFWTRPGGTNFNVSPPRRYNWEYKNSASFSWAMTATDAAIAGDYNRNGAVDSSDYVLWRKTLGQTGVVPFSGADGDGDGAIDADDYGVWRSRFGSTSGAGAMNAANERTLIADDSEQTLASPSSTTTIGHDMSLVSQNSIKAIVAIDLRKGAFPRAIDRPDQSELILAALATRGTRDTRTFSNVERQELKWQTRSRNPSVEELDLAIAAFDESTVSCTTALLPSQLSARRAEVP